MLINIIERAKELLARGQDVKTSSIVLDFFLHHSHGPETIEEHLDKFCLLDDYDVMGTIKNWLFHPDKILSLLCRYLCRPPPAESEITGRAI